MTTHILVLCTHNSARSVLGEGMLNHWAQRLRKDVHAFSAGSTPSGRVNPLALEVLAKAGVDVRGVRSKSWDEFTAPGAPALRVVITVCDSAAQEACPLFLNPGPDAPLRVHWGYPDPSNAMGGDDGRRAAFEWTRQAIGYRMLQLLALPFDRLDDVALQAALAEIERS
jgi:arsenate reductase